MEERSQVGLKSKGESTRGTLTISTNQSSGHEYTPAPPARSWEMVACQSTSVFPYRETEASLHQSCPVLYCVAEGYAVSCGVTITGMKLAYGFLSL